MANYYLSAFADEAGDSIQEQINALNDNGIGYIEPRFINGKGILALTEEELTELEAELTKNGIKVGSLGSPIGKYDIKADFETHLMDFEKAITACKILKTDRMRMFSFFVKQDELTEYKDEVVKRLQTMCDIAKKNEITLCHENESEIYGQMPREVNMLLDEVDGLKGIFDAANYRMNDADVIAGIDATLKKFAYIHIKDAHYASQTILPAGEGEGKLEEILDRVGKEVDGDVMLTVEPHLMLFAAYSEIDNHELKGKYNFKTKREAFDFAVMMLKNLLTKIGYKEENGKWIR